MNWPELIHRESLGEFLDIAKKITFSISFNWEVLPQKELTSNLKQSLSSFDQIVATL